MQLNLPIKPIEIRRLIPNILSISRAVFGLCFSVMINQYCSGNGNPPVLFIIALFLLICLTDLSDGTLARKWGTQSHTGALLDVAADSIYILMSLLVLNFNGIIPFWFTAVVLLKLLEFLVTSKMLSTGNKRGCYPFLFDYFGRIAAGGFFIVPGISFVFFILNQQWIIMIIINLIVILAVLSSSFRMGRIYFQSRFMSPSGLQQKRAQA